MASTYSEKTVFSTIRKFEACNEDQLIATQPFLEACTGVISILDLLGTAFSLPKKDVLGNIKRVDECYKTNPDLYQTMNVLLQTKKEPGAILWLIRAMKFLMAFIETILQDHKNGTEKENIRQNVLQAYESTLKHHHGKMAQFLFSNISRLVPHRKDFFKAIMNEPGAPIDPIFHDLELYLVNFRANIGIMQKLLVHHGLEDEKFL